MAVDKTKIRVGQVNGGLTGNQGMFYTIFYNGISTDWAATTIQEQTDLANVLKEFGIFAGDTLKLNFAQVDGTQSQFILANIQENDPDPATNGSKVELLEVETKTFTGTTPVTTPV